MGATPSREQVEAETDAEVKAETPLVSDIEADEDPYDDKNPLNMSWFWPFM